MIANAVTVSRIAASLALVTCAPSSAVFWILYGWCGISDMLDGPIARKTRSVRAAGARLDSASDLVFVIACAAKLLPVLRCETWLIVWVAAIALCKAFNLISNITVCGSAAYPHIYANKAAGLTVFATIPLLFFTEQPPVAIPACIVATVAAIQECRLILAEGKTCLRTTPGESGRTD